MRGIVLNKKEITSLLDTWKVTIFVPSDTKKKILHALYKKGEPLFVKERFQVVSCWEDTWNGGLDCEIYTGALPAEKPEDSRLVVLYDQAGQIEDGPRRSPVHMRQWMSRLVVCVASVLPFWSRPGVRKTHWKIRLRLLSMMDDA